MADFNDHISKEQQKFIKNQKLFFTATAPETGRINLSPKGMDTFRVIDKNTVAYLDFTGSGNETCAHLLENGRITIMFCSFDRRPLILRLYGTGKPLFPTDEKWRQYYELFEPHPGVRQIFLVNVNSVQGSCGYAVPHFEYVSERETLKKWADNKGKDAIEKYQKKNNTTSIDGKPIATPIAG